METGMIAMFPSATAPEGWAICDGTPHGSPDLEALIGPNTPDLSGKFPRGAGATALLGTGGSDTATLTEANLPAHSHGGATAAESAHTHTGGSGAMDANASHTHAGSTGTDSVNHVHSDPARNTAALSANHAHNAKIIEGSGEGSDGNYLDSNPTADAGQVYDAGQLGGESAGHVHSIPQRTSGANSVAHNHTLGVAAADLSHTHGFSLSAATAHTHATANAGLGQPFSIVPSHAALFYVIKK